MTDSRFIADGLPRNGEDRATPRPHGAGALVRGRDFRLALATIRPSLRRVEGPCASLVLEPRVMRVLMAFAEAGSVVLSRDDLMRRCWDGAVVSDDAINRTVAEIRRVARESGGEFGVETIPRIGYRLDGVVGELEPEAQGEAGGPLAAGSAPSETQATASPPRFSRRVAAAGLVAVAAGAGWLLTRRPASDPRFTQLLDEARQELRLALPGGVARARDQLQQAIALRETAEAQGWLALAWYRSMDELPPQQDADEGRQQAAKRSVLAAERALALQPGEPNASVSLALLQGLGEWQVTEQRLREVLQVAPDNFTALDSLVALLQGAGYVRESRDLNDIAINFDAQRPTPAWRRALKFWILGEESRAVLAAESALHRWPGNTLAWYGALVVYAFTGEFDAARMLLTRPGGAMSEDAGNAWRVALDALEDPAPGRIAAARNAMEQVATRPVLASHAIMVLATLGETEAAFRIFESRSFMPTRRVPEGTSHESAATRWHQWLFCPAARNLHADPRFERACDSLGLRAYWDQRGPPDKALPWLSRA